MADHGTAAYATADGNDLAAHEATYRSFLRLAKFSTAAIAAVLVLMAIFLT
ncbi:MAG: aa3-type cytochrome c oxidase subunit IV [Xanthobacteraceae bacterium]|nr:MAG: aa3-type cytochrome c oxidase subunit IV [Xanthobacteraceae bacterium]